MVGGGQVPSLLEGLVFLFGCFSSFLLFLGCIVTLLIMSDSIYSPEKTHPTIVSRSLLSKFEKQFFMPSYSYNQAMVTKSESLLLFDILNVFEREYHLQHSEFLCQE